MNEEKRLIWFDNKIIPLEEAKINVLSPTVQFGANVFEGIRCYWNDNHQQLYAFRLHDHIKRLLNSIKLIRFKCDYTYEFLINAFIEVIKANNYKEDISVRQTVFLDGNGSWFAKEPVNMFISPIPKKRLDYNNIKGLHCCVSSWRRINDNSMSPRIKVGANYINSRMAQIDALEKNFDMAIFLNDEGKVSECPGSCIFIIRDNKLITPPLYSSILESITRDTIIKFASKDFNIDVEERVIDRTELYISDEIFICGSAVEIMPVTEVDGYTIGNGKIGEITKKLHEYYIRIATNEIAEYSNWLTPIYS